MKKAAIIFVILFVLTLAVPAAAAPANVLPLAVPAAAAAAKSSGGTNELVTIFSAQIGEARA
ncbi:unknown [Anaerotruncus sp. CAG:528]|nr:unknown [Anaerotruncus sp. CAG:528]